MTLQLKVGKYYRNRRGDRVGPIAKTPLDYGPAKECPFCILFDYGGVKMSWGLNGKWSVTASNIDLDDLIEEWKDEETKTFEVIPGGGMKVEQTFDEVLAQRQNTHGDFTDNARVMQGLKDCVMFEDGWHKLTLVQREALHMILHKVGRIISGNPNEPDHWLDIAGYATLAKDRVN